MGLHCIACISTFLPTHRFHALSDKLIWGGGIRCLQFLKEFHTLDVVVVPKFCHHVLSPPPPPPPPVLDGPPHGRVHSMQSRSPTWSQRFRFRFFEAEIVHVFMFFERFMICRCVPRRLLAATGAVRESLSRLLW